MFYYLTLDLKDEGIDRSEYELDPREQKFKLKWTRAIYHFLISAGDRVTKN